MCRNRTYVGYYCQGIQENQIWDPLNQIMICTRSLQSYSTTCVLTSMAQRAPNYIYCKRMSKDARVMCACITLWKWETVTLRNTSTKRKGFHGFKIPSSLSVPCILVCSLSITAARVCLPTSFSTTAPSHLNSSTISQKKKSDVTDGAIWNNCTHTRPFPAYKRAFITWNLLIKRHISTLE